MIRSDDGFDLRSERARHDREARRRHGRYIDHDRVELSNLNRQHYFQSDIGKVKVEALATHLRAINPAIALELHDIELTPEKVPAVFAEADLLIEAFDRAENKRWLIEAWCKAFPQRHIVCGSGLSGCGGTETLGVHSAGCIHICGDEETDMSLGLCAARVGIVANMQANVAIEILIKTADAKKDCR
jgi:sulfur carrier protein ThiS adenylyltransferase